MTRPTTPVWRVFLIGKFARSLGFALAVIDGMISYKGMLAMKFPSLEAATIALFIAIFQAGIAYLITSGSPIGEELEARFFSDSGIIGGLRRVIGVLLILMALAFYLADISTNYSAFVGGALLPDGSIPSLIKASFAILAAIALSLGDEVLHLLGDVVDASSTENERTVIEKHGSDRVHLAYQRSYLGSAVRTAQKQGKEQGKAWQQKQVTLKAKAEDNPQPPPAPANSTKATGGKTHGR